MNSLFVLLGIESWKPLLAALLLPPVPFLLLTLLGARLILPRRGLGWLVVLSSVAGLWLTSCVGTADALTQWLLRPPVALDDDALQALKARAGHNDTAIVILGGGLEPRAPEYGASNLSAVSMERLRYGLWLGHATGLPILFSGGVGWQQRDAQPEAQIAARIASTEFSRPLKWIEDQSRDTRENALYSTGMLRTAGIRHVVLVTHGWHMPRAQHNFETAGSGVFTVQAAPMGLARHVDAAVLDWLPSGVGAMRVRVVLHELIGRHLGA